MQLSIQKAGEHVYKSLPVYQKQTYLEKSSGPEEALQCKYFMQYQGGQAVTWDCMQSNHGRGGGHLDLGLHVVWQKPCNDLEPHTLRQSQVMGWETRVAQRGQCNDPACS